MIVAGPEGFAKAHYRKFNIKAQSISAGDDYAMMREVLTRRFKRLAQNRSSAPEPYPEETPTQQTRTIARTDELPDKTDIDPIDTVEHPDLVLVDGGAGQLAVAVEVFNDLDIQDVALIGVAKGPDRNAGREHFYRPGQAQPIMLQERDPVLYFIQRLRDEAHRFAIGTHRARRTKAIGINPLDEIPGIGPTRKRALLKHFGSAKAVSRAGVEDLKATQGISHEIAQRIYDFFHEQTG